VPTSVAVGLRLRQPSGAEAVAQTALDVVCLADMEWDYAVWTNRQHVMSRLPSLASDVRVLYVAPPRFVFSEHVRRGQLGRVRLGRSGTRLGGGLWRVGDRLWVLQPRVPISNTLALRRARRVYCDWIGTRVAAAAHRIAMSSPVLWSYTPVGLLVSKRIRPRARVYDVVDDYASLSHYRALLGDDVERLDREATCTADLVFVTTPRLARQRRPLSARCVVVGNAADIELFAIARDGVERPADLADTAGPLVCFHGTLSEQKLDADLLAGVAASRPDWTFVLLGHEPDAGARTRLAGLDNVHLLGLKTPAELPAYLAVADAAIVPYRVNDYTLGIDALKAYECLAAGLPVAASALPCFTGLEPHVRTCRTEAQFVSALEWAIATPPPPVPLSQLEVHSWTSKAGRQLAALRRVLQEVRS
jgi:Glycosyl transferases group 1